MREEGVSIVMIERKGRRKEIGRDTSEGGREMQLKGMREGGTMSLRDRRKMRKGERKRKC